MSSACPVLTPPGTPVSDVPESGAFPDTQPHPRPQPQLQPLASVAEQALAQGAATTATTTGLAAPAAGPAGQDDVCPHARPGGAGSISASNPRENQSPAPVGSPDASLHQPSLGTLALGWPALDQPCTSSQHREDPPPAVLTGTVMGNAEAYCLTCLGVLSRFVPDDGRDLPTLDMVHFARRTLTWRAEQETFDGDTVGWPRPVVLVAATPGTDEKDRRYPVPWINGSHGLDGDFYSFRLDGLRSVEDRLCAVCGDLMVGDIAVGAVSGKRVTAGGWCHPRCMQISAVTCPHFARTQAPVVAFAYRGPGVGVVHPELGEDEVAPCAVPLSREELAAWAARDPWGLEAVGQQAHCYCPSTPAQ